MIDAYNQDRKYDRPLRSRRKRTTIIEGNPEMKALKSTVIYNPRWMKGIVGIVASRLIETYYRPTVVLTMSNGFVTGSARSVSRISTFTRPSSRARTCWKTSADTCTPQG